MGNSPTAFTSLSPTHFAAALLFFIVGWAGFRALFPRLSSWARKLAIVVLGVHVLTVAMSTGAFSSSTFSLWLWHLDSEWNIPSTLASAQLALVGFMALATAGVTVVRPVWHRLYLVGIALLFVYFACDEFFLIHESIEGGWFGVYLIIGVVVALATITVALHSPRRSWIWHGCLLIGLALSALGSSRFESYSLVPACPGWQVVQLFGVCSSTIIVEESLELLGIWLALVAVAGQLSDASARPSRAAIFALCALPALWVVLLTQSQAIKPIGRQTTAEGAAVVFESKVELHGFLINRRKHDRFLDFQFYLSTPDRRLADYAGAGYGISLIDGVSLEVIASLDAHARVDRQFWLAPGYAPVYRQGTRLHIPSDTPRNRALLVVFSLWREQNGAFVRQRALPSDLPLLSDWQVILDEITLKHEARARLANPLAVFENEIVLDGALFSPRAQLGESMEISFSWSADQADQVDIIQFLHIVNEDGGKWWSFDQQPLGERLPTRLWYRGMSDSETWHVSLPADLPAGQYHLYTGLYLAEGYERVPAYSEGIPFLDARIPLGRLLVEAS